MRNLSRAKASFGALKRALVPTPSKALKRYLARSAFGSSEKSARFLPRRFSGRLPKGEGAKANKSFALAQRRQFYLCEK
jgi:hypothetical protein